MRIRFQLAACVLALGLSGMLAMPAAAQRGHAFAAHQASRPLRNANPPAKQPHPSQRPPGQQRPPARQEGRQGSQNGPGNSANGSGRGAQNNPDWNRPAGGSVHADRPPSANTLPNYRSLPPQEKQRILNNNRQWQNLNPAQRQEMQERAQVWQKMTPAQRDHIKNDVLPRWKQMSPDRQRAIQNRLSVLQNMPESARNQHLNDRNFTRGMSEEDKSTLRDLSHLHVGGAPDSPNQ